MTARILLTDIETSPMLLAGFGLFNQNFSLDQIIEDPRIMGIGAKWLGGRPSRFWSEYHHSRDEMLEKVFTLLDEADAVVTYNGRRFDQPWIHGELEREGLGVPSPYKTIDLYQVGKNAVRFPSHKLQYLSQALLDDSKVGTGGIQLWIDCLWSEDPDVKRKAWNKMRRYCNHDVDLLEPLFLKLRPYLPANLNLAFLGGKTGLVCPVCESENLQWRGFARTASRRYRRYQCQDCGKWSKDTRMEKDSETAQLVGEAR